MLDTLLMLCKEKSVERLVESGTAMDESGILAQFELPTSVLDFTDEVLEDLEQFFIHDAYKIVCQTGMYSLKLIV